MFGKMQGIKNGPMEEGKKHKDGPVASQVNGHNSYEVTVDDVRRWETAGSMGVIAQLP